MTWEAGCCTAAQNCHNPGALACSLAHWHVQTCHTPEGHSLLSRTPGWKPWPARQVPSKCNSALAYSLAHKSLKVSTCSPTQKAQEASACSLTHKVQKSVIFAWFTSPRMSRPAPCPTNAHKASHLPSLFFSSY